MLTRRSIRWRFPTPLIATFLLLLIILPLFIAVVNAGRDFYAILGVKRNAKEADIKSAYRKLSKQYHPDKNVGDDEAHKKFVDIAAAYETLVDKEKRAIYDRGGEDALKNNERQQNQRDPFDIFNFFNGGGQRQNEGPQRGADWESTLDVTLEELYKGTQKEINVFHKELCEHCRGSGADSDDDVSTCHECGGQGHKIVMEPIGPGFVRQVQQQCNRCGGKGKIVKHVCHVCQGKKTSLQPRTYDFYIESGMKDGDRIELDHAADESPDQAAGHIIFVISTAPHPVFERRGNDLHCNHTITLKESLIGFTHSIVHLDNHLVEISTTDITPHGAVWKRPNEGMPIQNTGGDMGDLYIRFVVSFPMDLTSEQRESVAAILKQ